MSANSLPRDPLARAAKLEQALREALDLAEEGWGYASDYFRDKWNYQERLESLYAVLGVPPKPFKTDH